MKNINVILAVLLVLVKVSLGQTVPIYVPTNGLLAWYPFNANANDESGNGHNGTNNGAVLTSDRNGQLNSAYNFNGSSSYISVPDNVNFRPASYAVSCWALCNSTSGIRMLVSKNVGTGILQSIGLFIYLNNFWSWMCTPTILGYPFNSGYPPTIGQWYHIVDQFDDVSKVHSIYVNGVFVSSVLETISIGYDTRDWTFGMEYENNIQDFFFNGKIDDIGIWNRVLSQCEISQLYTSSIASMNIASSNNALCVGQGATLTASGSSSYSWNPGGNTGNSIVINPIVTTNYSVIGTSTLLGCISTTNLTQQVNPKPSINASTSANTICVGQSATLNVFGATNYTWTPGGNGASITISPTVTTTYNIIGTNSLTGCSNSSTITQFVSKCLGVSSINPSQNLSFNVYPNPNCGKIYVDNLDHNSVSVFNSTGQQTNVVIKHLNEKTTEINFDEAGEGLYMLKFFDEQGNYIQTSKIVVRK